MAATAINPTPTQIDEDAYATHPVDGDAISQENLYKEASPGAHPNLTLGFLFNLIAWFFRPQVALVADANATIAPTPRKMYRVPDIATADKTITLADPTREGQHGGFWFRPKSLSAYGANFQRADATPVAALIGGVASFVEFQAYDAGDGDGIAWHCVSFGDHAGVTVFT